MSLTPSLSSVVTIALFSISLSLFLFAYMFLCIIFEIHINDIIKYLSLSDLLH